MLRTLGKLFVTIVALLVTALAYGAPGGAISGTVKDPSGAPFKGAFVRIFDPKNKMTTDVLSDKDGHYQLTNLAPGTYDVRINATGFKGDPHNGVIVATGKPTALDFSLQKGTVRWSDLSTYTATKLLPDGKGKEIAFGECMACHQFQTRWAAARRDEQGWETAVNYMLTAKHYFFRNGLPNGKQEALTSYLNSVFGVDSTLPKSPADMPDYAKYVYPKGFSDQAMKIVYTEWKLPGASRMPWSAYPDKDGNLWLPYYNGMTKSVGRLNPNTGVVDEWRAPTPGYGVVHSAAPAADGTVWLAEATELNSLDMLDPKSGKITEYADTEGPKTIGHAGSKHTCRSDDKRNAVWCTGGPLTRFDRETKKFTPIAGADSSYGIVFDKDGNVWFASTGGGFVGRVDANTLKLQKWPLPEKPDELNLRRIALDASGNVWVGEHHGNKVARLDPKTGEFKEFPLPAPSTGPYCCLLDPDRTSPGPSVGVYALQVDNKGYVWYSAAFLDIVGRLNPKTGEVVEYPFPYSENTLREFFLDADGKRMWYASPANNVVGYFTLPGEM